MDLLGLSRDDRISAFSGLVPQGLGNQRRCKPPISFSTLASFLDDTRAIHGRSVHECVRVVFWPTSNPLFQGRWPLSKGRKGIAESSATPPTASLYRERIIYND